MIELIAYDIENNPVRLDVNQDEIILLTKQFLDLTQPADRLGEFTRSFALPATDQNDLFFGLFGDPSTVSGRFNMERQTRAVLIESSQIIVDGFLRFQGYQRGANVYNISIFGQVQGIRQLLGESTLAALDWSDLDHTPADIADTWAGDWNGGHMIYPVHDFGFGYGLYRKVDETGLVELQDPKNNSLYTPLVLSSCVPAFRLTDIIRRIFRRFDITPAGDFFEDASNDLIFVQADNQIQVITEIQTNLRTGIQSNLAITTTDQKIPLVTANDSELWDNTNFELICPNSGTYIIAFRLNTRGGVPTFTNTLRIRQNAAVIFSDTRDQDSTFFSTGTALTSINKGDRISFWIQSNNNNPDNQLNIADNNSVTLERITDITDTDIDPSQFWGSHKQIDLFRAFLATFNLVAYQRPETQKILNIESWDYYMNNGARKDWTHKTDLNSEIVSENLSPDLADPTYLSLNRSRDILNRQYIDKNGRPYGSYFEDRQIPFSADQNPEIELFFPGPTQQIIYSDGSPDFADFIVAKYYDDIDNLSYRPPGLQLFYYNGLRETSATFYSKDTPPAAQVPRTQYPYFSNFLFNNAAFNVEAGSLDINFAYWTPAGNITVITPTVNNLYFRYFRWMIQERFNPGNKKITAQFLIDQVDINDFEFNDVFIIDTDGTPVALRPVSLNNYSPARRRLTEMVATIAISQPLEISPFWEIYVDMVGRTGLVPIDLRANTVVTWTGGNISGVEDITWIEPPGADNVFWNTNTGNMNPYVAFSLGGWVAAIEPGRDHFIISKGTNALREFYIGLTAATGRFFLVIYDNTANGNRVVYESADPLPLIGGGFNHIMVVSNGRYGENDAIIFVNGELIELDWSYFGSGPAGPPLTTPVLVGRFMSDGAFVGEEYIDRIKWIQGQISQTSVRAIIANESDKYAPVDALFDVSVYQDQIVDTRGNVDLNISGIIVDDNLPYSPANANWMEVDNFASEISGDPFTTGFTVLYWHYYQTGQTLKGIMSIGQGNNVNQSNHFSIYYRSNIPDILVYARNGSSNSLLAAPITLNPNTWYMIGFSYDPASGVWNIFVNGDIEATKTVIWPAPGYSPGNFRFFREFNMNSYSWDEYNDRIRYFDRALLPPMVKTLYVKELAQHQGTPFYQ